MRLHSWVCPTVVTERGGYKSGGCGGDWGLSVPATCPTCHGELRVVQTIREIRLADVQGDT